MAAEFKRGVTLCVLVDLRAVDPTGATVDVSTWTPKSQIFFPDHKVRKDIDISFAAPDGSKVLLFSQSDDWPLGVAFFDVILESPDGQIAAGQTYRFEVVEGPTLV